MNDDELMTAVRESFADVRSTTELEQIAGRGRALRARRRVPTMAAAVGAAAAAALAINATLPGRHHLGAGHPASSYPVSSQPPGNSGVRLAAWTVTRQADGTIYVTFRQATDPAGLQSTLRADGVPASVTFTGQRNPACQAYPVPSPPPFSFGHAKPPLGKVQRSFSDKPAQYALVIRPKALPPGTGLQIWTSGTPGGAGGFVLFIGLVRASPQCTGS
jgi:hypothetical protein